MEKRNPLLCKELSKPNDSDGENTEEIVTYRMSPVVWTHLAEPTTNTKHVRNIYDKIDSSSQIVTSLIGAGFKPKDYFSIQNE